MSLSSLNGMEFIGAHLKVLKIIENYSSKFKDSKKKLMVLYITKFW